MTTHWHRKGEKKVQSDVNNDCSHLHLKSHI